MSAIHTSEFRVMTLRECLPPGKMALGDMPERCVEYIRAHVHSSPAFNPDLESMAVLILNTRRRILGHVMAANGTRDTILVNPTDIFRAAVIANAAAVVLTHNHPSGDPTPSEADIKVTRDLMRGGQLLKIDVLDHLIMGHPGEGKGYSSLRELGYFYS